MYTQDKGITRRKFIALGAVAMGGLALASQIKGIEDRNRDMITQPKFNPTPEKWRDQDLTLAWSCWVFNQFLWNSDFD